jgi:hypothetical protein
VACDNIPTPEEARQSSTSATPIAQPEVVPITERRAAGDAFEKEQVKRFEDELVPQGLLGDKEDRAQAKATGASRRGGTGRMDYFARQDDEVSGLLFEMKNSNFDRMKPENVRANVLGHARQLHRYLSSSEVGDAATEFAMMFAVYNERPNDPAVLNVVESALAERGITPVWAEDYDDTAQGPRG